LYCPNPRGAALAALHDQPLLAEAKFVAIGAGEVNVSLFSVAFAAAMRPRLMLF